MKDQRLQEARRRLQTALIAGEPTAKHRDAIAHLEGDQDAAAARQAADAAAVAAERESAAAERSKQLAAAARERIARNLSKFDVEYLKP